MTAIYIILIIIVFLVFIFISPIYVTVLYEDELLLKLRFLCFSFKFNSNKGSEENSKDDSDKPNKKEKKISRPKKENKKSLLDTIKENGIFSSTKIFKELMVIILKRVKKFITHIKANLVDINYVIVGEDASDTAIKYGVISSIAYYLQSLFYTNKILKKSKVNIIPGFNYQDSCLELRFKANVRMFRVVSLAFAVICDIMKYMFKLKYQKNK